MNNNPHEIFDLKTASQEQIRALQLKALEILVYFKDFCEKHNLLFYLCGGCCIGAIRHKGFIPWDDDIDVFMPRKDYERLKKLWNKYGDKEKYTYCRTDKEVNYHHIVTTIRDNNTTFINTHSKDNDIHHGLGIDIIPLDVYPSTKFKRTSQMFFAMLYSLFNAQRLPDNQGKLIRLFSNIILKIIFSQNLRYKLWTYSEKQMTKYNKNNTEYITEITTGLRYMKLKYPKEIFEEAVYKRFDGYQMPIPVGYDKYLKMAFGDYMSLPPKEKQVPQHNTIYINLEKGYKNYKGIYYCTD